MARLKLNDGYTIKAKTLEAHGPAKGLPVVAYEYRPALPDAIYEWRWKSREAREGKDELTATAALIAAHVVGWDVEGDAGILPVTAANVRLVPEPILSQILDAILTWAPKEMAEAAKNS